ncbi:uncharacterized protein LOC100378759 [Saccoglossus kowalevskii]|uniref:Sialomucin core protein 24-like n=1 Tax=Saccoglossus kowalevskii TaxID=10224 RepID=A0ABM0GMY0_SACKO|nr:PREDICTED: sialomucin core protein 24-like [Saccoglossus kowalevskii]
MDRSTVALVLILFVFHVSSIIAQDDPPLCSEYTNCQECNDNLLCVWGACSGPDSEGSDGCVGKTDEPGNCTEDAIFEEGVCDELNDTTTAPENESDTTSSPDKTTPPPEVPTTPGPTTFPIEQTTNEMENPTTVESDGTTEGTEGGFLPSTGASFSAASFVGGIILCGGVILIAFIGCKFYQSRSKNYTTL